MAVEPESEEVQRLLSATSVAVDDGPDLGAIHTGIRRRRRVRRGIAGFAVVLFVGLGGALALRPSDEATPVDVLDDFDTTVPPPTTVADLGAIGPLAPEGIAIQTDAGVELRGLDGTVLHVIDAYELATDDRGDGLRSTVTNVLPLRAPDGSLHWFDPASGMTTTVDGSAVVPLWHGVQAEFEPGRGVRSLDGDRVVMPGWTPADEWWLSSDHRAPSVVGVGYLDSAIPAPRSYSQPCWVAAFDDARQVQLCAEEGGHSSIDLYADDRGNASTDLGLGTDGQPRQATAAWLVAGGVLVRTEEESCFVADAMVLRDGVDALTPLLGQGPAANPSSAPIGVAIDGRAIVHLNAAACEASAAPEDLGVHLIDLETGNRTQVWAGAALSDEVRAWTTLPLAPQVVDAEPEETGDALHLADLETVTPDEIGRDLLVFGDGGITRIVGGQRMVVWDQPVEQAFDDGAGGVLFQDPASPIEPSDLPVVQRGAIRHAGPGGAAPREVVPESDHPWLLAALPVDQSSGGAQQGRAAVDAWFTREDRHGSDDLNDWTRTLYRTSPLAGGEEQVIGDSGSPSSGVEGIARLGDGRTLFSTCHTQCAIRPGLNDPDPIVLPHWIGGLDGALSSWGYVRFDALGADGNPTTPALTIHDLSDVVVTEVPLPEEIGWMTYVDLSSDGTAALVWSVPWNGTEVSGPVYVDGLDTDAPRVRAVASGGQQIRFVG